MFFCCATSKVGFASICSFVYVLLSSCSRTKFTEAYQSFNPFHKGSAAQSVLISSRVGSFNLHMLALAVEVAIPGGILRNADSRDAEFGLAPRGIARVEHSVTSDTSLALTSSQTDVTRFHFRKTWQRRKICLNIGRTFGDCTLNNGVNAIGNGYWRQSVLFGAQGRQPSKASERTQFTNSAARRMKKPEEFCQSWHICWRGMPKAGQFCSQMSNSCFATALMP